MARSSQGWTHPRAWLAIVLSYLLVLEAFVLVAAPPTHGDAFGVICTQNRSTPNKKNHDERHDCCPGARCCVGVALPAPPAEAFGALVRYAGTPHKARVSRPLVLRVGTVDAFRARAPPSFV